MVKKSYNEKLNDSKDLPRMVDLIEQEAVMKRLGGRKMLIAAPLQYNKIMSVIPYGKVITVDRIRSYLAKEANADVTCPLTAGIFTNICANASEERNHNKIAWWRTLKKAGELNEKYPGGIEEQKRQLEIEGHMVIEKGTRYFVENYEAQLYDL